MPFKCFLKPQNNLWGDQKRIKEDHFFVLHCPLLARDLYDNVYWSASLVPLLQPSTRILWPFWTNRWLLYVFFLLLSSHATLAAVILNMTTFACAAAIQHQVRKVLDLSKVSTKISFNITRPGGTNLTLGGPKKNKGWQIFFYSFFWF